MEAGDFPADIREGTGPDGDDEIWPLSPDGHRFTHVATATGCHFRRSGADEITLFYEPHSRVALLTFDWS